MKKLLFLLFAFVSLTLFAASGDVTIVDVHQEVDLHWQGSSYGGKYDEIANFPAASKDFQEIELSFSIGCNNAGVCSHWDYDMDIYVGEYSGEIDSNISTIDTITYQIGIYDTTSTMPLTIDTLQNHVFVGDTNWDVFDVIIWHELGRMITPYGTYMDDMSLADGWDNTWWHTYKYDVTDFRPFLQGSTPVRVRYHGWQDGWRVSTKFKFVEGKPARDVIKAENIYSGGSYTTFSQFDAAHTPSKTIALEDDVLGAKLKVIITGHGQYGEFTPHSYTVKSGSSIVKTESMWRDDCGLLPISPQGGTWIFNRANWCPGDAVEVHEFDLTDFISGSGNNKTLDIDIDLDDFVPTSGASYSLSAQLISYSYDRRKYDVSIEEVIAPSLNENFVRFNPICAKPIVRLRNNGYETITKTEIKYWVNPNNYRYYQWSGSLKQGEFEDVTLEQMDWTGVDVANPKFWAKAQWPNDLIDQFAPNDVFESEFEFPDVYNMNDFKIRFKANNQDENNYIVKNAAGAIILNETNFNLNGTNDKNMNLLNGGYVFEFFDVDNFFGLDGGGDGINWWLNIQNNYESIGYLRLLNGVNSATLKEFNPDFGSKIFYSFLVNTTLDQLPPLTPHTAAERPDVDTVYIDGELFYSMNDEFFGENKIINSLNDLEEKIKNIQVYPNPTNTVVSLKISTESNEDVEVTLNSIMGKEVKNFTMKTNKVKKLLIENVANGVYFLNFKMNNRQSTRKLIINR